MTEGQRGPTRVGGAEGEEDATGGRDSKPKASKQRRGRKPTKSDGGVFVPRDEGEMASVDEYRAKLGCSRGVAMGMVFDAYAGDLLDKLADAAGAKSARVKDLQDALQPLVDAINGLERATNAHAAAINAPGRNLNEIRKAVWFGDEQRERILKLALNGVERELHALVGQDFGITKAQTEVRRLKDDLKAGR